MSEANRYVELEDGFFWIMKDEIQYDSVKETFYDYLVKEKTVYDRYRPLNKLAPVIGVIITLIFTSLYSVSAFIDLILSFFVDGSFVGPPEFQSEFFSLLIITSIFASILGQLLVVFMLTFKYFFTKDNWSRFHDQTLLLSERLVDINLLNEYVEFSTNEDGQKGFKFKKLSVDFQIEWIFPFIFQDFPPLLFEIMLLSFMFPFSIATLVSLIVALSTFDFLVSGIMLILFSLIILGVISNSKTIYKSWSNYSLIRNAMIDKQHAIIHNLALQGENDLSILRNEYNLARLVKMHPFPLPSIFRITTFIPLVGSLLGYVVGISILI